MYLSKLEKENLLEPFVIGSIFGLLVALATYGFTLEYGPAIYSQSAWSLTNIALTQAFVAFVSVLSGCVLVLGLLPIFIPRAISWLRKFRGNA